MLGVAVLLLALTRAEIIERFRTPPITKAGGLVQVFADCPKDMRQEFQMPVASFAAEVCRKMLALEGAKSPRYAEPGVVVYIGEERTNRTDVLVKPQTRADGSRYTRLYLPAPGFSDVARFRLEVVKAFYRATAGTELDDAAAEDALVRADPVLRANREYERLARWMDGAAAEDGDDEAYLKLARSVIVPGVARASDVLRFASRLRLYPDVLNAPFARRYPSCTFAEAIDLAEEDPRIRLEAFEKAPLVVAYGGGRSEELAAAAEAYSAFLFDLARYTKPKDALRDALEAADVKLNVALEKAREYEQEQKGTWR